MKREKFNIKIARIVYVVFICMLIFWAFKQGAHAVPVDNRISNSDTPKFTTSGEFMFVRVGAIDVEDIYDKEQDPGYSKRWGLTKTSAPVTYPDSAFGGQLELFGLFGNDSVDKTYYYKIHYSSAEGDSGYIQDDLRKKNYQLVGTGIVVNNVLLGPIDVTTASGPLNGVYRIDERLSYESGYSTYWTEAGLRAIWETGKKNGNYTLSIKRWRKDGTEILSPPSNNYASLNLRLVNNPPECKIHEIQWDDGTTILSGTGSECKTVELVKNDSSPGNDTLQFRISAQQGDGFMGEYKLSVWQGHGNLVGNAEHVAYTIQTPPVLKGITNFSVPTWTSAIPYKDCAYRFKLRVSPRITNGCDSHIYEREDNWYVCVKVIE